jgi:hypothetical protein
MTQFRIKPTKASQGMIKASALIVTLVGGGMLFGALSGGLLEEAGPFGIVWMLACVSIIAFSIYSAFNRKVVDEGFVEIDDNQGPSSHPETTETRLRRLDELKQSRLITDDEYRKQREKILESL